MAGTSVLLHNLPSGRFVAGLHSPEIIMPFANARASFSPDPSLIYLDASTYGLPPDATIAALQRALQRWQAGTAEWVEEWDREGDVSRELFARLIGTTADSVALVPTVSVATGIVAASLPQGAMVVVPEEEFTSVSYPFSAAAEAGRINVVAVPYGELTEAIKPGVDLVAFSLTRSQTGETADLAAICDAASAAGVKLFVDATHAIPFISVADQLDRIDYLACHGYKHLLCPRGAGFFVVHPDRWNDCIPYFTNWYAAAPRYQRHYGVATSLPETAGKYDVSLAWHSWVGARVSLELLVQWQREGIFEGTWELTRRLAAGLGLPEPRSTVLTFKASDADAAERAIAAAGIRCAVRAGNIRLAPHVYNTVEEIDRAIATIAPLREHIAVG
jgi:selenocysteine lyase/cysteine desulfurase